MLKILKTVLKERKETKEEALVDRVDTYCTKFNSNGAFVASILDGAIDGTRLGLELIGGSIIVLACIGASISDNKES